MIELIDIFSAFLAESNVRNIAQEYTKRRSLSKENGFNIFRIISDLYYREKFHSDIIWSFLDPDGKHGEGNLFLNAFIDMLNGVPDRNACISKYNYIDASVLKEFGFRFNNESGAIDILIKSESSKHCIIIENKINNASDTKRQLPKYYDCMTGQGFEVDAIVYIPLAEDKCPDQSSWIEGDIVHINEILYILPAYSISHLNLVDNWLKPCSMLSSKLDCISVLRQYGELIMNLSNKNMDNLILEQLYDYFLKNDENHNVAISLRDMVSMMPTYMADRLCNEFKKNQGDYRVWKYKDNFCGILFQNGEIQYKIDIWTHDNGYGIYVFGQNQGERFLDWATGINSLKTYGFIKVENKDYRLENIGFKQENDVIKYVKDIINDIREYLQCIES